MPWVTATLRGQKVYARALEDGTLLVEQGGRVEVRYKPADGRAYRASAANVGVVAPVVIHPDDFCAEVSAAPAAAATKGSSGAGGRAARAPHEPAKVAAGEWIAYTDGACSGNPGPCGLGVVVIAPDGRTGEGSEFLGNGTNNVAELTAIWRAVEAVPPTAKAIVIHTDSQYAIGVLGKGWKAKANQALIAGIKETIVRVTRTTKVRFVYVPGHAGVPLNERADELAREAIKTQQTRIVTLAPLSS